jgi:hypothetical protein
MLNHPLRDRSWTPYGEMLKWRRRFWFLSVYAGAVSLLVIRYLLRG